MITTTPTSFRIDNDEGFVEATLITVATSKLQQGEQRVRLQSCTPYLGADYVYLDKEDVSKVITALTALRDNMK